MRIPPPPPIRTVGWRVVLALLIASCTSDQIGMPGSSASFGVGAQPGTVYLAVRTIDDDFATLADEVPGFAGLYYDSSQVLTIRLKNPSTLPSARGRTEDFLASRVLGSASRRSQAAADVARMRAEIAKYDFRELLTWYRTVVLPSVGLVRGVSITDVDEGLFQVTIQPPFNPIRPNATCQFTAVTSNGTGNPDTYEWFVNSSPVGANSPYYLHTAGTSNFTVSVIVTSTDSEIAQASLGMSVNSEAEECFEMLAHSSPGRRPKGDVSQLHAPISRLQPDRGWGRR